MDRVKNDLTMIDETAVVEDATKKSLERLVEAVECLPKPVKH